MQFLKRLFPYHKQGHLGMCFLCLPNTVAPSASMCSPHSAARCTIAMPSLSRPPWYNVNPACCGKSVVSERNKASHVRQILLPKLYSIPCVFRSRAQGWFKGLGVLPQPLRTSQNVDPCTKSQNLPEAAHVLDLSSPTSCQHASSPCSLMVSVPLHTYLVRKLVTPVGVTPESVPCRRGLPTWSHNLF